MKTAVRSCLSFAPDQSAGAPSPDCGMSSWCFKQYQSLVLIKPLGSGRPLGSVFRSNRPLGLQTENVTKSLTQWGMGLDPNLTNIRPTPPAEVGQ